MNQRFQRTASAAAIVLVSSLGFASGASQAGIVDAVGDYVPGYRGSTAGDLDVLSASAVFNVSKHVFTLSGTMAADIGTTPTGFYVWGVDRGQGTARFAANGISGVLFDMVVVLNPNGSGTVRDLLPGGAVTALPAGFAHIVGDTISVDLAEGLFPDKGLGSENFTWNLWPRDGSRPAGFGQISDFAPDNSNFKNDVVPEPASLLLVSLAGAALLRSSRRKPG
jgi:PEP-CTERM motif